MQPVQLMQVLVSVTLSRLTQRRYDDGMRQLPEDDRPKFERLAAVLQQDIERGDLEAGKRVPSVRELRTTFDVSEGTVIHALRLLRERHLVWRDSTRGHFVRESAGDALQGSAADHTPEYEAIMSEIQGLRSEMQSLAHRLGQLEDMVGPQ
jgi:DNA-binding GntR family transcriptional regulator